MNLVVAGQLGSGPRAWHRVGAGRIAREREQPAEAYAVRVVHASRLAGLSEKPRETWRLAVIVSNHGAYTITRLEAQFSYDGKSLTTHRKYKRKSGFEGIDRSLTDGWREPDEEAAYGVLTPWDQGVVIESDAVHEQFLKNPYPLVRWTDRWGTRWEHRLGQVRRIRDDEPWAP